MIALGVKYLERSKIFYGKVFGWTPAFENDEIVFYQMNGFVFGTFLDSAPAEKAQRTEFARPGPYSLAHNVRNRDDIDAIIEALLVNGGKQLRAAGEPEQGDYRGYVVDPDDHTWKIAWNPAWPIDENGLVKFKSPDV